MLSWMSGAMGHAVSAHQDLSRLLYANIKIDDVPGFTAGILNFSYISGWLHSKMCLHGQSFLKLCSWALSRLLWAKTLWMHFNSSQLERKVHFVCSKKGKDSDSCAWHLWTPFNEYLFSLACATFTVINFSCAYNFLLGFVSPSSKSEKFSVVIRPLKHNLSIPPATPQATHSALPFLFPMKMIFHIYRNSSM